MMNYKKFYFWLQGFLSNKKSLSEFDIEIIKAMMLTVNEDDLKSYTYPFNLKTQKNPYQMESKISWDNNNETGY